MEARARLYGSVAGNYGYSVAGIGDVNDDGIGDFAVGFPALAVGALNGGWFGMAFAYSCEERAFRRSIHLDVDGIYGRPSK